MQEEIIQWLTEQSEGKGWQERLALLGKLADQRIVFSTSFSYDDQALAHAIATTGANIVLFTLDTGRMFEETYQTQADTVAKYPSILLKTYHPDAAAIENYVAEKGINGFYDSLENRKRCCYIRKVEPLKRALAGADIWISGVRHEHSDTRENLPVAEWDSGNNVIKFYPLLDATTDELWQYVRENNVPYNKLHDKGFPSIGCAPCTRAIEAWEHPRAGRWWWEQGESEECGLHVVDGKLVRVKG